MATDDELDAAANQKIADAVRILRDDGLLTSLAAIKKHLQIIDEPPTDPNAPPKPPKKDPPKQDDPPVDPPAKRRHWLFGDLPDDAPTPPKDAA